QYQQIIYDWNDTDKDYPSDKTIHQLFEEQVGKTPDDVAVIYEETKSTYKELNEKANRLANYLRQISDIKASTLVALCLDRSEYMLVAILAVLKAGGAYVPIDPSYPDDRIHYILTDTNTKLLLTNEIYGKKLSQVNTLSIIPLDNAILQQQLLLQSTVNLEIVTNSTDLMYVIYTSGTTGNPKGVMIEHRSIVNRIQWMNNVYPLNRSDKILQKTPYVFDVSVWELLWANCYGTCVVFAEPNGHKDTQYIRELVAKESITIVHFVPSMLSTLLEILESKGLSSGIMSKLRYVFCSGEALSLKQVKKFQELLPNVEIHNLYGPTEASVDVLSYDCNNKNIQTVLIGKAIQNTTLYVLDDNLNPVPISAVGELYIGGVGLARGYLNRADLTAEKFIANPFQTEEEKIYNKNTRLYKTGDLVRWLPDGNLEYIGRNDFQVKIRGYRIELGEIENALSSYDGIKQNVVIAKEHKNVEEGNKYLVGYYVSESKLNEENIISYLQKKLPEYMMPSVLVHLKELPLTINGKLDRKALPEPEFSSGDHYVAPRSEVEKQVCEIWANVLGLAIDVGIHDDFFSTEDKVIINKTVITNVEEQLLSFAQERLWFIEKYEEGTNAYNIPMIFKLSNDIKLDILEKSIGSVVARHEILRTLIKENNEEELGDKQYQQIIYDWNDTNIDYLNDKTIHQLFEEQVEGTPDNIAVIYEETKLTYRELNERANQLANYLKQIHDIKLDTLVVLCLGRSEYMLITILAVLKAGGAYVPIDPSYPNDRVKYILADTGTKLILTNEVHKSRLEEISKQQIEILAVDSGKMQKQLSLQLVNNPNAKVKSTDLAYVIYTSGTTGNPKGVMTEHIGVINLKYDMTNKLRVMDNEVILLFANYVFDTSVEQIILSLLNGHVLLLIPNQLWLDKEVFYHYLSTNNVTHMEISPKFLEQCDLSKISSLRRVIAGGEALTDNSYSKIISNSSCEIINSYGPTEVSITSIINIIGNNNIAIGKPIANISCYVLDNNLMPLPIGGIGELYIGGVGLARGYLNRPDLTAEKFIANPFQTEEEKIYNKNTRLYKTGDLVRWLPKLRDLYSDENFNLTIWDEYGPTEATVGTCNSKICLDKDLTIGKPYSNYRILVLDNNLMPLPIGGIGELYIGGVGLARGYLNRPDLTAEKFIANPFQTEEEKIYNKNTRLYKTGDLVRWLPDGNLEYIGRNDF
ncbi:unnamed protein product, partial [Oppiella nova]